MRGLVEFYRNHEKEIPDKFARHGPWGAVLYIWNEWHQRVKDLEKLRETLQALQASELNKRNAALEQQVASQRAEISSRDNEVRRLQQANEELGGRYRQTTEANQKLWHENADQKRLINDLKFGFRRLQEEADQIAGNQGEKIARLLSELESSEARVARLAKLCGRIGKRLHDFESDADGSRARALLEARREAVAQFKRENHIVDAYTIDLSEASPSTPSEENEVLGASANVEMPPTAGVDLSAGQPAQSDEKTQSAEPGGTPPEPSGTPGDPTPSLRGQPCPSTLGTQVDAPEGDPPSISHAAEGGSAARAGSVMAISIVRAGALSVSRAPGAKLRVRSLATSRGTEPAALTHRFTTLTLPFTQNLPPRLGHFPRRQASLPSLIFGRNGFRRLGRSR